VAEHQPEVFLHRTIGENASQKSHPQIQPSRARKNPASSINGDYMAYLFDDFQKFGQEHLEVAGKSSSSLAESWLAMRDSDTEWQIGETMAVVLRERLMELETLEATGKATEETVSRLAFVRKLLVQFDAKDGHAASVSRPANTNRKPTARGPASARTG